MFDTPFADVRLVTEELPTVWVFASRIADLSDPAPESLNELTVRELAGADVGVGGFAAVRTEPPPLHPAKAAAAASKNKLPN
jgi:hypothetical protein